MTLQPVDARPILARVADHFAAKSPAITARITDWRGGLAVDWTIGPHALRLKLSPPGDGHTYATLPSFHAVIEADDAPGFPQSVWKVIDLYLATIRKLDRGHLRVPIAERPQDPPPDEPVAEVPLQLLDPADAWVHHRSCLTDQLDRAASWSLPAVAWILAPSTHDGRPLLAEVARAGHTAHGDAGAWQSIDDLLQQGGWDGVDTLLIGGGEPLGWPDLPRVLGHARASGVPQRLVLTTAAPLAAPGAAQQLHDAGATGVIATLLAPQAALHATLGGASHDRVLAGLDAAHAAGLAVTIDTIACTANLDRLAELAELARTRWSADTVLLPWRADDPRGHEPVPLRNLANALATAGILLAGFPRCVLPDHPAAPAHLALLARLSVRALAPVCELCDAAASCPGLDPAQIKAHGSNGLRPRFA